MTVCRTGSTRRWNWRASRWCQSASSAGTTTSGGANGTAPTPSATSPNCCRHSGRRGCPSSTSDATALDSPLRPDRAGNRFKPEAAPERGEPVVSTESGGAVAGTDLEGRLREADAERPVLVGFTTDRAVSTTARTAAGLGFEPSVVVDASVAFERSFDGTRYAAEQSHRLALAHLAGAYATVVETATLLAALEARR